MTSRKKGPRKRTRDGGNVLEMWKKKEEKSKKQRSSSCGKENDEVIVLDSDEERCAEDAVAERQRRKSAPEIVSLSSDDEEGIEVEDDRTNTTDDDVEEEEEEREKLVPLEASSSGSDIESPETLRRRKPEYRQQVTSNERREREERQRIENAKAMMTMTNINNANNLGGSIAWSRETGKGRATAPPMVGVGNGQFVRGEMLATIANGGQRETRKLAPNTTTNNERSVIEKEEQRNKKMKRAAAPAAQSMLDVEIIDDEDDDDDIPSFARHRRQTTTISMNATTTTNKHTNMDMLDAANYYIFGNERFRPNQREICEACVANEDVFVLMPTGGGKTLCYALPAVCSEGVTVVFSPLVSLVQDQVKKLIYEFDIPSVALLGSSGEAESKNVFRELFKKHPTIKLLYVTPEKFQASAKLREAFQSLFEQGKLARFVVDEAHCVSSWGHDFRPDYKKLSELKVLFPSVPLTALTATATDKARVDVLKILKITKTAKKFVSSFNRANITFEVKAKGELADDEKFAKWVAQTFGKNDNGIVYCLSRDNCVKIAEALNNEKAKNPQNAPSAVSYHAGMTEKARREAQDDWTKGKVSVCVATIAFGMGIDKANVRWVVHHSPPKTLEGLYQEIGRAGRDGEHARGISLYAHNDLTRVERLLKMPQKSKGGQSKAARLAKALPLLEKVKEYMEDRHTCRRVALLSYLGETSFTDNACRGTCDNCRRRLMRRRGGSEASKARHEDAVFEEDLAFERPKGRTKKKRATKYSAKTKKGKTNPTQPKGSGGGGRGLFQSASSMVRMPNGGTFRTRS